MNQIALIENRRRVHLIQAQGQDLNALPSTRTLLTQINGAHRRRGVVRLRQKSGAGEQG